MKNKIFRGLTVALATVSLFFASCEDEVSNIGNSISSSDININVDSLTYKLESHTIKAPDFESRSNYSLLGSINVPEYGALECSYVTQFLPVETLNIPDSIKAEDIDSVKMILSVPKGYITGDSIAPQQLKIYDLTKQLPQNINTGFNPEDYYNQSSLLATKNYTLSGYQFNDTTFISSNSLKVGVELPVERGRELVTKYRTDPNSFVWPQDFAKYWPGIYVTPSFGKGCIAPVQSTGVYLYYPMKSTSITTNSDGQTVTETKVVADSICVLISAPEVISNVNIDYVPSENIDNLISQQRSIITTPSGYAVSFTFPALDILNEYWSSDYVLGVINNMKFSIPAKAIPNAYGIGVAPALLMVKTSEMATFFAEGKLPDNKNSFYSLFSSETNSYSFNSMREYMVALQAKGKDNITPEDVEFTLIPVEISTEDYTDPSTGGTASAVTAINPYILKPTMTELDTDKATVVFTYSNQILN